MQIRIANYLTASFLLEQERGAWDCLAILDSRLVPTRFVEHHSRRRLFLRFDDVESDSVMKQAPVRDDVERALDFASDSTRLIVTCRAGQSRSAAIAYLKVSRKLGAEWAAAILNPRRHIPNRLIISPGGEFLGDETVVSAFESWCAENSSIRLGDYIVEIDQELVDLENQGAGNLITESP